MKHLYKIGLCVTGLIMATSCVDYSALDFEVDKPLSIAFQEEINAYADLKTYVDRNASPNFLLGAGISLSDMTQKGVMYRLLARNFDEITLRSGMNHGAIVQSNGSLSLTVLEDFVNTANEAGTKVFGQPLTWHLNQNASYLKSLLSPLIVESPAFANSLDISGLSSGTFSGWVHTNGVTIVDNEGMGGGVKAVQFVAGSGSSQAEELQLVSPEISVVPSHEFEIICYIKSDKTGEAQIAFEGLNDNTPRSFNTSPGWQEIRFRIKGFQGNSIKVKFNMGQVPDVTYYLDINNLYVYDTQGEPLVNNLILNGDFENGIAWGGWGNGSTRGVTEVGGGVGGEGRAFWVNNPSLTNFWAAQSLYELPDGPLELGKTYNLSFWVKGDGTGNIRPEMQSPNFSSNGFGVVYPTSEWQLVTLSTTISATDRNRFIISYGEYLGTVYMDKFVLSSAELSGGSTTVVEKTPEEKTAIINVQLENWISGMVGTFSPFVKAWDVVKDPMDDSNPLELKTGVGKSDMASHEFYWQDYLGKDYGVKAFKLAREKSNNDNLLFINDRNLENNLDKCQGLIKYIEYLESQGAKVDGIGAQMQLSINSDKAKIAGMFELLAATGKLIKVSELSVDLGISVSLATEEHYEAQRDMYKYVVEKYLDIIPAAKRYGITVWNPIGESVGLWTEALNRKPAYAGFADGLKK